MGFFGFKVLNRNGGIFVQTFIFYQFSDGSIAAFEFGNGNDAVMANKLILLFGDGDGFIILLLRRKIFNKGFGFLL